MFSGWGCLLVLKCCASVKHGVETYNIFVISGRIFFQMLEHLCEYPVQLRDLICLKFNLLSKGYIRGNINFKSLTHDWLNNKDKIKNSALKLKWYYTRCLKKLQSKTPLCNYSVIGI